MATISDTGKFWRPDEPDKKMPGLLTFDEAGGRVELSGELGDIDSFKATNLQQYRRLIGESQREIYTLDGCRRRRYSTGSANGVISNLELQVQTILVGEQFDAGDELAFDSIEMRPAFLENWAPADWLDEEYCWREQETRERAQLTVKQVEPETAQIMDSLKLTIGSRFHISGDGIPLAHFIMVDIVASSPTGSCRWASSVISRMTSRI